MDRTNQGSVGENSAPEGLKRGRVLSGIILAAVLGVFTFAPTGGITGDSPGQYNCIARSVVANYTTANAWQQQTVCNAGEGAVAAGGHCPGNLRAVQLSANGGPPDRLMSIMCSSTGQAEWVATCCVSY